MLCSVQAQQLQQPGLHLVPSGIPARPMHTLSCIGCLPFQPHLHLQLPLNPSISIHKHSRIGHRDYNRNHIYSSSWISASPYTNTAALAISTTTAIILTAPASPTGSQPPHIRSPLHQPRLWLQAWVHTKNSTGGTQPRISCTVLYQPWTLLSC